MRYKNLIIPFTGLEEAVLNRLAEKCGMSPVDYLFSVVNISPEEAALLEGEEQGQVLRGEVLADWAKYYPQKTIQEAMEEVAYTCEMVSSASGISREELLRQQGIYNSFEGHLEIPEWLKPRIYCGGNSEMFIVVQDPEDFEPRPVILGETTASLADWAWHFECRLRALVEEECYRRPGEKVDFSYYHKSYVSPQTREETPNG